MVCGGASKPPLDVVEVELRVDEAMKAERSRLDVQWKQLKEAQQQLEVDRARLENLRALLQDERSRLEIDREDVDVKRERMREEADGWGVNRDRDSLSEALSRGKSENALKKKARGTFTGSGETNNAKPEQSRRQGRRFSLEKGARAAGDDDGGNKPKSGRRGSLVMFAKDVVAGAKKTTRRGSTMFARTNSAPA